MSQHSPTLPLLTLLALLLLAAPVRAEQIALRGATIHPVDGPAIEGGQVVIDTETGTILSVSGPDAAAPAGARVVDLSGKRLTPGLVDMWTGLGLVEVSQEPRTSDADAGGEDPVRAAFLAADAFNPAALAIAVARDSGVTSALAAPWGGLVPGQATWVELRSDGVGEQARVIAPRAAMVVDLSDGGVASLSPGEERSPSSRGQALRTLRELLEDTAHFARAPAAYDANRSRQLLTSRLDLQAMQPVLAGSLPVALRVHRADQIRRVLALSRERGLRPIIVGGAEAWKVADLLAEQQVPVVLDPLLNLPFSFEGLGARADNAALLHAAGVPIALSTFDSHNVARLRQLAGNAVRAGLSHDAALRAVTLGPATILGQGTSHGRIAPGARANLVAWSGDPFELSSDVERVWIDGVDVPLDSRQKMLLERYRTLERRAVPGGKGVQE